MELFAKLFNSFQPLEEVKKVRGVNWLPLNKTKYNQTNNK